MSTPAQKNGRENNVVVVNISLYIQLYTVMTCCHASKTHTCVKMIFVRWAGLQTPFQLLPAHGSLKPQIIIH